MLRAQILGAVGLIRPSRRRGFCPACRLFQSGDTSGEVAAPAVIVLAFLIVAALTWALTIVQSHEMDDMTMGLGSVGPFLAGWVVMVAAMMLPSASPLVFEFARSAERRRGWQLATALLGVTYLSVWLVFGVVCFALYNAVGMPWPNQALLGGTALVIAGLYALTPLKRASEARCRELCALHGPLPFNLMRSAIVSGARYGLSCVGCSAGLMLAIVLIGMSNVIWMVGLTAVMLAYRLAPGGSHPQAVVEEEVRAPTPRWIPALSAGVIAVGVVYIVGA